MSNVIPFRRPPSRHDDLVQAVLAAWRHGDRPPELFAKVRAKFPEVSLIEWNAAADEAWPIIWADLEASP